MSADVHSLVGAYAVDAIDEQERAAFERHLAECPECRAEVASLAEAGAQLALVSETAPPPAMRDAVLAGIRTVRPLPPLEQPGAGRPVATVAASAPEPPHDRIPVVPDDTEADAADTAAATPAPAELPANVSPLRRRRPVAEWLVGAAAAIALIAGGIAWSPWDDGGRKAPVSASEQVLEARDAQRVVQTIGNAKVTVVRSPSLHKAVVIADNMAAAPTGKDFQFWFDQPGKGMVNAGVMPHGTASTLTVMLEGDAATASAAGITLEPAGGSPEPTSAPLALFSFS
jgi:anti-sigma-K factor RskA